MKSVAHGDRSWWQVCLTDPIIGLMVGCVVLLFYILPLSWARIIGRFMGEFVGMFCRRRNQIALLNLQLAFPKKSVLERQKILHQMWCHFGQVFAEIPHAAQVLEQAKITGLSHLKQAYRAGKGGFVCSAHFGNWEIPLGKQVAPDFCLNPVYRVANNWMLNLILFRRRQGVQIPKGPKGARLMIQLLKQGKFISILCDQKLREGMIIPFFSMPARTATAIAGLALRMHLPILMVRSVFDVSEHRYHVEISAQLSLPKMKNHLQGEYQVMNQINQIYESWITQYPEQWLWIHRRFDKAFYRSFGIN